MLVRPLSFLSISARLVFALIRLLMRGLKDEPSVSAAPRACTCPTTRSSPNGRRGPTIPDSTMPLGPVGGTWVRPFRGKVLYETTKLMQHNSGDVLTAIVPMMHYCPRYSGPRSCTSLIGSLSPNGLRR